MKFKTGWVGHVFHSSLSSVRNCVIILVRRNINFSLIKQVKDAEGRMICVQAIIEGVKVTLCNILPMDWFFFMLQGHLVGVMDY